MHAVHCRSALVSRINSKEGSLRLGADPESMLIDRWIGRRGQTKETKTFYTVVIVRLIESGSLYTASLIIWVVFQVLPNYVS